MDLYICTNRDAPIDILNFSFGKTVDALITGMKQWMGTLLVTTGKIMDTGCLVRIRFCSIKFGSELIVLTAVSGTTAIANISHGKHLGAYYGNRLSLLNNTSQQHLQIWCLAFGSTSVFGSEISCWFSEVLSGCSSHWAWSADRGPEQWIYKKIQK